MKAHTTESPSDTHLRLQAQAHAQNRPTLAEVVAAGERLIDGAQTPAPGPWPDKPSYTTRGAGPDRSAALLSIPIAQLVEDPGNARKSYDANAINELAASIKACGILQPLIVRRATGTTAATPRQAIRYHIVAGHRRRRAAEIAGLTEVPCVVRDDLNGSGPMAALVENLQREDLTPLEEAEAYNRVMQERQLSAAQLAGVIGKGARYVQQRAAIARTLIEPARKALVAGRISASHADELARLPADFQKEIWEDELGYAVKYEDNEIPSVKSLREDIARRQRKLHGAPWKLDNLAEGPGVHQALCKGCQWNSGGPKPTCQNPPCFEARLRLVIKRKAAELAAGGKPVRYTDDGRGLGDPGAIKKLLPKDATQVRSYNYASAKPADKGAVQVLVVAGPEAGRAKWVKPGTGGISSARDDAATKRWREQQRKKAEKEKKAKAAAEKKLAELLPRIRAPLSRALRLEVLWLNFSRMWSGVKRPVLKRHGWEKLDDYTGKKLRAEIDKLTDDQLAQFEIEVVWSWRDDTTCSFGRHKGKTKSLPQLIEEHSNDHS